MVIDFAAYRRRQVQPSWLTAAVQQELVCANLEPAHILSAKPVAPLPSPPLPCEDEDLAAFQTLAYSLATQL